MGYGLSITNPSGDLVVSTVSAGYRYLGTASVYSTSVKTSATFGGVYYGDITPWLFRVTMANTTDVPVFGLEINSGVCYTVGGYHIGSGVWEIAVYNIAVGSVAEVDDFTNMTVAAITVHVWAPYTAPTGYGLVLYTDTGAVAFSGNQKPLIVQQIISATSQAYSSSPTGTGRVWTPAGFNTTVFGSQDFGAISFTKPVLLTNAFGAGNSFQTSSGNLIFEDMWGYMYSGGHLYRKRSVAHKQAIAFDPAHDEYDGQLNAGTIALIEGSGL